MPEPEFIPAGDEAPSAEDAFRTLEESPAAETYVVVEDAPQPVGRSWAFDFSIPGFVIAGRGPAETRGMETLRTWIAKTLVTDRGAYPIHPDGYGFERPFDLIGQPLESFAAGALEERVENALTFHPRITGIDEFTTWSEEDGEALFVSFVVLLDGEEALAVEEQIV